MSKKKWSFSQASRLAGNLYGSLLLRNSDPDGYQWCIDQLVNGESTVRDLVKKFCTSDEYREKNLMNQTPNEFAKILCRRFLGNKEDNAEEIKKLAISLLEGDWREAVGNLIDSDKYHRLFGDDKVPA